MQQGANQPKGPPANVEQRMAEMFPDLELTAFIREHRNLTPEALASLIVDRRAQIPKKRKRTENGGAAAERQDGSDSDSDVSTGASEDIGDLLIDKFLAVLIHKLKVHIREGQNAQNRNRLDMYKRQYLTNKFISVRTDFIDKMLFLFHQALFPTAIACFIAEHNYANKLRPVAPDLNQKFWQRSAIPMTQKRRFRPRLLQTTREIEREFNRFMDAMRKYSQGKYAELFNNDLKLRENHNQVRWNRPEPQQKIECRVCFEKYPAGRMTYCTAAPVPKATTANQPSLKEDDKDKAGPSSKEEDGGSSSKDDDRQQESAADTTTAMDDNAKQHQQQQTEEDVVAPAKTTSSEDGRSTDGESAHDPSTHPFCRHCIRGQAQAATQQQPLAEGGVGLCCMVPGCKNPILYSDVRPLLSAEICKKLDERIIEENLGMALLSNLERCKRCNYAVIMEVDKRINKVFQCLKCDAKFCRICENDWDDDHFGVSCEEVDQKLKRDRKDRDLEKQLNEAIIRKCPRCGVAFMKDQGCNKMTCRCGMTSCYICRATRIDYGHFCQHIRNPNNPDWKCQDCNKKCLLFEDPKKRDERLIAQIRQEWAERMQREREQQLANAPPGQQQPQQRNAPQPPPRPIRPPAFVRE